MYWVAAIRIGARAAWRSGFRSPGLAMAVIGCAGLGIGANVLVFAAVNDLFFRPPPHIQSPNQLVRVLLSPEGTAVRDVVSMTSYPILSALEEGVKAFSSVVGYHRPERLVVSVGTNAHEVQVDLVTENFFSALGVPIGHGPGFSVRDDVPTTAQAIVSLDFWRRHFSVPEQPSGMVLSIAGRPYQVVGVAPAGFSGPDVVHTDVWLGMSAAADQFFGVEWRSSSGYFWLRLVARLAPRTSPERAARQAEGVLRRQESTPRIVSLLPLPLGLSPERSPRVRVATWLVVVALLVLATASANVIGLLLARTTQRHREISVCMALGASRATVVSQVIVEAVLLIFAGGAFGLWMCAVGGHAFRRLLLPDLALASHVIDWRVVLLTLALTLITAAVTGGVAARAAAQTNIGGLMKGLPQSGRVRSSWLQVPLVALQTGIVFALLVGTGLFTLSFARVKSVEIGLRPDVLVVAEGAIGPRSSVETKEIFWELRRQFALVPGVEGVAVGSAIPFQRGMGFTVWVPHLTTPPQLPTGVPSYSAISSDFFAVSGTQILRGRPFGLDDRRGGLPVAIVNQTMARHIWQTDDVVGKCIHLGSRTARCTSVVGVSEDVKQFSVTEDPRMQFYVPLEQAPVLPGSLALFLRLRNDDRRASAAARHSVVSTTARLQMLSLRVRSIEEWIAPHFRDWALGSRLFGAFGLLAAVVAFLGVYGLVSYETAHRAKEIGVRLALGALPTRVLTLIVGRTLRLAAFGLLLGIPLAAGLGLGVRSLLYGVPPIDARVFFGSAVLLIAVIVAGGIVPALRAASTDPATTLRSE